MTAYTFTDAERAVIDLITASLSGRAESYFQSVTVGPGFPSGSTGVASVRHVQVELDGTPAVAYPVTERATVRVTCWLSKGKRTDVKAMAGIVQGLMLAQARGGSSLLAILPGTGRLVDADRDTGLSFCTFTVRVSTQPLPVA